MMMMQMEMVMMVMMTMEMLMMIMMRMLANECPPLYIIRRLQSQEKSSATKDLFYIFCAKPGVQLLFSTTTKCTFGCDAITRHKKYVHKNESRDI